MASSVAMNARSFAMKVDRHGQIWLQIAQKTPAKPNPAGRAEAEQEEAQGSHFDGNWDLPQSSGPVRVHLVVRQQAASSGDLPAVDVTITVDEELSNASAMAQGPVSATFLGRCSGPC